VALKKHRLFKRARPRKEPAAKTPAPNPFSPFRQGRGKPSLRPEYLLNERDKLYSMIEGHWYVLEWNLSRARTLEGVHKAFTIAKFKPAPGPLAPMLRDSFEEATVKQFEKTRKELGKAYERSRSAEDRYQAQLKTCNDAELATSNVSDDAEKTIRQELRKRSENLRTVVAGIQAVQQLIRDHRIWNKTRAIPASPSPEISAWIELLRRLECHKQAEEPVCAQLAARIQAITPEARKIATENTGRQKSLLMSAEHKKKEAYLFDQTLETKRLDQEAFVYRNEILKFLKAKEYRLTPFTLANAIAGLPYITARRSAQLCSKTQPEVRQSGAYEIFQFVKRVWKQIGQRLKFSVAQRFEREIRLLPKFRVVEGQRQTYWLRTELAKDWYYLRMTLQDPELAKLPPGAIPGAIVAMFLQKRSNPESPVTPMIAEANRIKD
jgi:hypothetical protein